MPYCPRCSEAVEPEDAYCPACGERLRDDGELAADRERGRDRERGGPRGGRVQDAEEGRVPTHGGAGVVGSWNLPPEASLPQETGRLVKFGFGYPVAEGIERLVVPLAIWTIASAVAVVLALVAGIWIAFFDGTYGLLLVPAALVVGPGLVVLGHAVGVGDAAAGGASVPPPFTRLYDLLAEGTYAVLALAPFGVAAALATGAAAAVATPLALPVVAAMLYVLPAVATGYAATGDVTAAYHPGRLASILGSLSYLKAAVAFLPVLAVTLVVVGLSLPIPFLPFVTIPYAVYVWFAYWGGAYYRFRAQGVVPTPDVGEAEAASIAS